MEANPSSASSAASSVEGAAGTEFLNLGMFAAQAPSSASDGGNPHMLLGGSAFGSASLGLAGAGGGSGFLDGGSSFDLSDFPTLAGTAGSLRQQQQQQHLLAAAAQQQQKNASNLYRLAMNSGAGGGGGAANGSNFSMTTEDFPALQGGGPAAPMGSSLLASQRAPSSGSGGGGGSSHHHPYGGGSDFGEHSEPSSSGGLLGGAGLGGIGAMLQQQQQQHRSQQPPLSAAVGPGSSSVPSGGAGNALAGDYGLLGLLAVIRMTDADRNALALGSDLTLLGLNLGSAEQIYSTFSGPWSDAPTSKEPHFQLPSCYYMQPPALKTGHLSKFQLETLFYIFYALPKDVLQAYAAQELYAREWRYHAELKLWFQRATAADGAAASGPGASAQFVYFDAGAWERRIFSGQNGAAANPNLSQGFLSEEEVRVKFSSATSSSSPTSSS